MSWGSRYVAILSNACAKSGLQHTDCGTHEHMQTNGRMYTRMRARIASAMGAHAQHALCSDAQRRISAGTRRCYGVSRWLVSESEAIGGSEMMEVVRGSADVLKHARLLCSRVVQLNQRAFPQPVAQLEAAVPCTEVLADGTWSKSSTTGDPCKGSPYLRFLDAFSFHSDHRLRLPSQQRRGSACSGMARSVGTGGTNCRIHP